MTRVNQIYKCNICGNIVEVLHAGAGQLVCCGQPMQLLTEKIDDIGKEKHIPIIEIENGTIKVKVGSIAHPMESNHYIEWVEIIVNDEVYRKTFKPGIKPEVELKIGRTIRETVVRVYCNIHGLWKSTT